MVLTVDYYDVFGSQVVLVLHALVVGFGSTGIITWLVHFLFYLPYVFLNILLIFYIASMKICFC